MEQDTLLTIAIEMLETTNVYNKDIRCLKYKPYDNSFNKEVSLVEIVKKRLQSNNGGHRNRTSNNIQIIYDAIAYSMEEYIDGYLATYAFKQRTKQKFKSWLYAIQEKYNITDGFIPEELMIKNEEIDTGIAMIKALHNRDGVTKKHLHEELGISVRSIQKNLRKISPSLCKGEESSADEQYTPFRLGGQPLQAKIKVTTKKEDVKKKDYYLLENTVHPIVLQENIMQLGTLFKGLSYSYQVELSNISTTIGMDIWSQLSDYAKYRLKNYFAAEDEDLKEFIDVLEDEFPNDFCTKFCTEREMMKNENMTIKECLMFLTKRPKRTCTITIIDSETGELNELRQQRIEWNGNNIETKEYIAKDKDGAVHYFDRNDVRDICVNY